MSGDRKSKTGLPEEVQKLVENLDLKWAQSEFSGKEEKVVNQILKEHPLDKTFPKDAAPVLQEFLNNIAAGENATKEEQEQTADNLKQMQQQVLESIAAAKRKQMESPGNQQSNFAKN